MRGRPYRLIGERLRGSLSRRLEPLITEWVEEWLPEERSFSFLGVAPLYDHCRDKGPIRVNRLVSWVDDNWCAILRPVEEGLLGAMLIAAKAQEMDELASSMLLRTAARQALIELAQRLLSGFQASHDNIPSFVTDNPLPKGAELLGSGAMVISFKVDSTAFDYVVSPVTVERYIEAVDAPTREKGKELAPLNTALGNQKVRASISLGSAELSLGELASIRIGDVVTLDKLIDQPASMRFGVNGHACEGFLGVKENSLAFRVSRIEQQNSY